MNTDTRSVALFAALILCGSCRHAVRIAPARAAAAQSGWIDLRPKMELRVENADYRDGAPKHGVEGYLGTETAHFQVRTRGLRLLSIENPLKPHPREQLPVQELIPEAQRGFAHYRYFFAVVFNQRGNLRGSVLLGAASAGELDRLSTALMSDPDSICRPSSSHCAVFPEMCTVSIDLEIFVNGSARTVCSGSVIASVVSGPRRVELLRRKEGGGMVPVKIDLTDPNALRAPLMPGDQILWQ